MGADERLARLLGLRGDRPKPEHERWLIVEKELGLVFPTAYKNMVDEFGETPWADFLHVLSPFSENPYLNLQARGRMVLDADRTSRESFPAHFPLPLHPEVGGLLPWAITDNGDTFYWITAASPNEWPTVIKGARAPEFEVNFSPPHLLVHRFMSGKLCSKILPSFEDDA